MSTGIKNAIMAVEDMIADIRNDYPEDMQKSRVLENALGLIQSELKQSRLRYERLINSNKAIVKKSDVPVIRLSKNEKWLLISLLKRPEGLTKDFIRADSTRLIQAGLIDKNGDVFQITGAGIDVANNF